MNTITKLFVLLAICFHSQLHAQNSRLFYQSKSDGLPKSQHFTVAEYNGVPYFFAIKESNGDFVKLTYGPLDEQTLSPISYHYITLPVSKNHYKFLNGINIVGNRLDMVIQSGVSTTNTKFEFIEIDLALNTVLNTSSTQEIYHKNFFRARSINQKLVVYGIIPSSSTLTRIEKELTSDFVVDTVSGMFNTSVVSEKLSELIAANNQEYLTIITGNNSMTFIKRNALGESVIIETTVGNSTRQWDFIPFEGNTILFIGVSNVIKFDAQLNVIDQQSGTFLNYNGNLKSIEAMYINNMIHIYSPESWTKLIRLNTSFQFIDEHKFDREIFPYDIITINNKQWMIGSTRESDATNNYILSSLIISENFSTKQMDEHQRVMKINDFQFYFGNYSRLFTYSPGVTASMTYGDGVSDPGVIFASSDNLLGKNAADEQVGIWGRFTLNNKLLPGPSFTSVADTNMQQDKYNRSYYVTSQMIADHVGHILDYNNPNYGIPNGILYWPANGNPANGESQKIADFIDHNNNGIYEPLLGEFPKIYGDKCLLTIYHQADDDSLGNNLEVHRYLFAYDCDTNEILKNTLFCNVRYINRGGDIHDAYAGSYIDYDMGYSADDYVGTNVELGMIYSYNGDTFDETNGSQYGFHGFIPAHGHLILSGAKMEADGEDNEVGVAAGESINGVGFGDGIVDNEYYTLESSYMMTNAGSFPYTDAVNSVEFYYNLQGLAADGTPQILGAIGPYTVIGESDPLFYATGGVPHLNNYSEAVVGNASGDRRVLSGSGPGVLLSGDTLNFLSAYILSFGNQEDPKGPSVGQLFSDAQQIKNYFSTNDLGCGKSFDISDATLSVKPVEVLDFLMYPNPFDQTLNIQHDFIGNVDLSIRNLNGQEVFNQTSVASVHSLSLDLNAGIYFVELSSSKGKVIKKLVRK